jgi:PAS domain-containing protein
MDTGKANASEGGQSADFSDSHVNLTLQAAVRAGKMGLWQWHAETGQAFWSPEVYDLLRLPRGSGTEVGERFVEMIHRDDVAAVDAALAAVEAKGGIDPFVFRIIAGDGSTRWLMSCAQVARAPGETLSRLVGVNIDVTDAVEAEARLREASAGRERQELIMQAVMEHAPVGIAVTLTGEEDLAYVNRFGSEMISRPVVGTEEWDALQVYHLDGRTPAAKEQMALHRAASGEVIRNEEWLIRAYDGSLLPVSCNAGPIVKQDGSIIGATVVWYDVSPFKEAQRQRESFMAAVSHELRTPLSAILGWAQVLNRTTDPEAVKKGVDAIRRNAETQARLIDDLLDISRMAAGKLSMRMSNENLLTIVKADLQLRCKPLGSRSKCYECWGQRTQGRRPAQATGRHPGEEIADRARAGHVLPAAAGFPGLRGADPGCVFGSGHRQGHAHPRHIQPQSDRLRADQQGIRRDRRHRAGRFQSPRPRGAGQQARHPARAGGLPGAAVQERAQRGRGPARGTAAHGHRPSAEAPAMNQHAVRRVQPRR